MSLSGLFPILIRFYTIIHTNPLFVTNLLKRSMILYQDTNKFKQYAIYELVYSCRWLSDRILTVKQEIVKVKQFALEVLDQLVPVLLESNVHSRH